MQLKPGDRLEICLVCGAGYGDPLERDAQAVLNDVLDGLINVEEARRDYGVVLSDSGRSVDTAETTDLRRDLLRRRP